VKYRRKVTPQNWQGNFSPACIDLEDKEDLRIILLRRYREIERADDQRLPTDNHDFVLCQGVLRINVDYK
jgi:hypothetical protein